MINNIPELFLCTEGFVFIEPVHTCNRLQQGMLPESTEKIHHRISWRIKSCQQFTHDNQDFRVISIQKLADDLFVVFFFRTVSLHHLLPELDYLTFWLI